MTQPELFNRFREVENPEQQHLEAYLDLIPGSGFITARTISAETGWDDRKIRDLASASDTICSTNAGYKLISRMTRDEYGEFRGRILKQCDRMRARIARTDTVFFGRMATT